jgi:hypothetical protein
VQRHGRARPGDLGQDDPDAGRAPEDRRVAVLPNKAFVSMKMAQLIAILAVEDDEVMLAIQMALPVVAGGAAEDGTHI